MNVQKQRNGTWRDEETMKDLASRGLSQEEMAEELGCSQSTVSDWLDRHGINHDVRSERSGNHRVGVGLERREHERGSFPYERWKAWDPEEGNLYVYVHRLAAVAWFGFDVVEEGHVHHASGHSLDNRESNLLVVDPETHHNHHLNGGVPA